MTAPRRVVALDIETIGQDWETLSPQIQTYLTERAKGDEDPRDEMSLHPGTGRIVAIGLWDPDAARGRLFVEGPEAGWAAFDEETQVFRGPEAALVREFWRLIADEMPLVVTFYGRTFDVPYLMLRSAILGVPPSRNLMGPRYKYNNHCDLYEVLTFSNASRLRGGLEFWCHQFGLASPKMALRGGDVASLYREARLDDIGRYCLDDARAAARLYERLKPMIALLD